MSFRNRLALFFIVIVIVPMVAVAAVMFRLIADNETGKADAGLAQAVRAVTVLYRRDATGSRPRAAIAAVAADPSLARALNGGDAAAARRRAMVLVRTYRLPRLRIAGSGLAPIDLGDPTAIAPIARDLVSGSGRLLGRLELSYESAGRLGQRAAKTTGMYVVIDSGDRRLTSTIANASASLPRVGDVSVGGRGYRVGGFVASGFGGTPVRVSLLSPRAVVNSSIDHGRLLAGILMAGFLLLAFSLALLVSRSLQREIAQFLEAARRLAAGDFEARVTVPGRDEFAALGSEFNSMAEQLANRLEEIRQQRGRLGKSVERMGETLASNLDREALLELLLGTAVDSLEAEGGRASARQDGGALGETARSGPTGELQEGLRAAEAAALRERSTAAETVGEISALAQPLVGSDGGGRLLGLISVARRNRPFGAEDRELLDTLGRQASVSLENVSLHEQVKREAVTDELTGLANQRHFRDVLESEAERGRRFDQPVGLLMLDLDDFKGVNDSFGHQQGDAVLRAVAEVMRAHSREIDTAARYGGEELAIVLPQTDIAGAFQLAERLREAIAGTQIDRVEGADVMGVTASIGVASIPASAADADRLIAAADAALYEAKRTGKNKTIRAR